MKIYLNAVFGIISNTKFQRFGPGHKVLIVNFGALGDFVHSIPLVEYLSQNGFDVKIRTKDSNKLPLIGLDYDDTTPAAHFDMVFNVNAPDVMLGELFFANTFDFFGEKVLRKYIKKDWKEIHWADFYLNTAEKLLGLPKFVEKTKHPTSGEKIIIHPGASAPEKSWGDDNFVWLAEKLSKKYPVWIVLGPAEYGLAEKFKGMTVFKCKDLDELTIILSYGRLFIGNDSGVMHVASLFDMPIVGIFSVGCAHTHYPRSPKADYWFDEEQFMAFYKKKRVLPSKLTQSQCLKMVQKAL